MEICIAKYPIKTGKTKTQMEMYNMKYLGLYGWIKHTDLFQNIV